MPITSINIISNMTFTTWTALRLFIEKDLNVSSFAKWIWANPELFTDFLLQSELKNKDLDPRGIAVAIEELFEKPYRSAPRDQDKVTAATQKFFRAPNDNLASISETLPPYFFVTHQLLTQEFFLKLDTPRLVLMLTGLVQMLNESYKPHLASIVLDDYVFIKAIIEDPTDFRSIAKNLCELIKGFPSKAFLILRKGGMFSNFYHDSDKFPETAKLVLGREHDLAKIEEELVAAMQRDNLFGRYHPMGTALTDEFIKSRCEQVVESSSQARAYIQ